MNTRLLRGTLFCLLLAVVSSVSFAQFVDVPLPSQHSVVMQRIGLTDITINYHRPLVNNRKVWGGLVPYGQVWRAGANENTTITFTDPVTIEGKPLDAGTYGLHMLPTADDFTVIFSKTSTAWGSFTYNQSEDTLRVTVKSHAAEMHNALTYDFDDVQPQSTVITMTWEKLAVPFKVGVDVHPLAQASIKKQIRGISRFTWEGWDGAANYLLAEKYGYDDALDYANKSIEQEDRYDNEMTKSKVLTALNRKDDAATAEKKALALASPLQLHGYARGLVGEKRLDEAYVVFRDNATKHPDLWFTHVGLARMYSSQSKFDDATKEMKTALSTAPDDQKTYVDGLVKRLEAKQDINQ
jgi:hypothetical protein